MKSIIDMLRDIYLRYAIYLLKYDFDLVQGTNPQVIYFELEYRFYTSWVI